MASKHCTRCDRLCALNRFSQVPPKDGKPRYRKDVCKACEADDKAAALAKKNEVHSMGREVERQVKALAVGAEKLRHSQEQSAVTQKTQSKRRRDAAKDEAAKVHKEREKKLVDLLKQKKQMSGAEREIAQRALCRRKLLPFIQKFNKSYDAGWVHQDICTRLEKFVKAVEKGEAPRLMLFMPPRHGKSEIASKNFPAWMLGQHPDWEIIAASYAVSLPVGFSRKVQSIIQDDYYSKLFPKSKLHPKSQSAESWLTTAEGGYVAAGVGGGITGKGAHVFIIDDPVKDAEEADSDTQRGKVWDWWGSTAKTRLSPGGGVLVIQTRWHDDDLSGRLLLQMKELKKEFQELMEYAELTMSESEPGTPEYEAAATELLSYTEELGDIDDWEVVSYPAMATEDEYITEDGAIIHEDDGGSATRQVRQKGQALHDSRYPIGRLRNMKRSMQPRHWSALYQQNPVPDEGIYFTKDMLRFTSSVPPQAEMHLFQAWDLAIGEKQQNDFTVGACGGLDWQGNLHILEILRFKQSDTQFIAEAVLDFQKKYTNVMQVGIEKGALEIALWPTLKKEMKRRKQFPTFNHDLRPITDKWVRARPLQGRMQQGMVQFPSGQTWTEPAVQELLRFPGGLHDDIVDALAWLMRMVSGRKEPQKPGHKKNEGIKKKLNKILAEQGKGNQSHMGA